MESLMYSFMLHFLYRLIILVLLIVSLCFASLQPLCLDHERSSLLQFKESFFLDRYASIDPLAYPKFESWTVEGEKSDCCSWDGVVCDQQTGHVISLDLSSSYLYGSINSSSTLFSLVHLQRLNLADNDFNYSQIPTAFSQLSRLSYLNLSLSVFFGQVPYEISGLSKLSTLDLSVNIDTLSGEKLLQLKKPDLKSLILNLTSLEQLSLSYVDISSTVPDLLANMSSLKSIILKDCGLKGEFPIKIFHLPNLQILSLRYNKDLYGILPPFQHRSLLKVLRLKGTSFHGELPPSIEKLESLIALDASECNFSGLVPSSIGKLNQLNYLDLSGNNLSGQLPSTLANLTHLIYLSLSSNGYNSGTLSWVCDLTKLSYLSVWNSNLTGLIPSCLGNLTQLTSLSLQLNQFTGPIPQSFSRLTNLETLFLQDNDLSGIVDFDMFLGMKSLSQLYLSDNKLSVVAKPSGTNSTPPQLTLLGLDSCNLSHIPDFLRYQERLEWLNLRGNQIGGKIPKWILNTSMETLVAVNLAENFLVGFEQHPVVLPWVNLRLLQLASNMLKGPLPIPPPSTFILNVSNNNLSGEIPLSICNLGSLQGLDLSNNKLRGALPQVIGNLKGLLALNLSNNILSGGIPSSFGNLTEVESLDLSQNKLSGEIPQELTKLKFLAVFNVSHNSLTGPVPQGNQFDTFESSSYEGNLGLCGSPLPQKCGSSEASRPPPPSMVDDDEKGSGSPFGFGWRIVAIGYGCGLVIGFFIGQIVISRKKRWFAVTCGVNYHQRRRYRRI